MMNLLLEIWGGVVRGYVRVGLVCGAASVGRLPPDYNSAILMPSVWMSQGTQQHVSFGPEVPWRCPGMGQGAGKCVLGLTKNAIPERSETGGNCAEPSAAYNETDATPGEVAPVRL
jgi:hypothetical protein